MWRLQLSNTLFDLCRVLNVFYNGSLYFDAYELKCKLLMFKYLFSTNTKFHKFTKMTMNNHQQMCHFVSLKMYQNQNADIVSTILQLHFCHELIFHETSILRNVIHR